MLPWKGVEAPGALRLWECDAHTRHQRGVQDDGTDFVPTGQIYCGYRADALTVQYNILRRDTVAGT